MRYTKGYVKSLVVNIAIPNFDTEDDSWESPFKILTVEEIDYLYENGYLNQK